MVPHCHLCIAADTAGLAAASLWPTHRLHSGAHRLHSGDQRLFSGKPAQQCEAPSVARERLVPSPSSPPASSRSAAAHLRAANRAMDGRAAGLSRGTMQAEMEGQAERVKRRRARGHGEYQQVRGGHACRPPRQHACITRQHKCPAPWLTLDRFSSLCTADGALRATHGAAQTLRQCNCGDGQPLPAFVSLH